MYTIYTYFGSFRSVQNFGDGINWTNMIKSVKIYIYSVFWGYIYILYIYVCVCPVLWYLGPKMGHTYKAPPSFATKYWQNHDWSTDEMGFSSQLSAQMTDDFTWLFLMHHQQIGINHGETIHLVVISWYKNRMYSGHSQWEIMGLCFLMW